METVHHLRLYAEYCRRISYLRHNNNPDHTSQYDSFFYRTVMPPLCSFCDTAAYLQNCRPASCFSYLSLLLLPNVLRFSLLNCILYSSDHSSNLSRPFHTLMLIFPPRSTLSRQLVICFVLSSRSQIEGLNRIKFRKYTCTIPLTAYLQSEMFLEHLINK